VDPRKGSAKEEKSSFEEKGRERGGGVSKKRKNEKEGEEGEGVDKFRTRRRRGKRVQIWFMKNCRPANVREGKDQLKAVNTREKYPFKQEELTFLSKKSKLFEG